MCYESFLIHPAPPDAGSKIGLECELKSANKKKMRGRHEVLTPDTGMELGLGVDRGLGVSRWREGRILSVYSDLRKTKWMP